jgi:hypothetical protein
MAADYAWLADDNCVYAGSAFGQDYVPGVSELTISFPIVYADT